MSFNLTEAIHQITSAATASQILAVLSAAVIALPPCTSKCIQASGEFTQKGCATFDTVVPVMDSCLQKECPSSAFEGIADILNLQPLACLQFEQLVDASSSSNATITAWSVDDAAKQILKANNGTQVFSVLSESFLQLPACVSPCFEAAVHEAQVVYYSTPPTGEFFDYVCSNFDETVQSVDTCITTTCHAETIQSIASILNLQPLACLQLQHFTKLGMNSNEGNWTVLDTAMAISAATTTAELTFLMNAAVSHLPECAAVCFEESVPKGLGAVVVPYTEDFYEFACNNADLVGTNVDACVKSACITEDVAAHEGMQEILNLQSLGCLQFENLLLESSTSA
ncbi:hypothetical protein BDR26DRAFT_419479 [Obelidium mucronatum]|nr:hypothetical protein BDR26DRAFT_419479 [Obelidium mucronatum]